MADLNAMNDYAAEPREPNASAMRNVTSITEMPRHRDDYEARINSPSDASQRASLWLEQARATLSRSCALGQKRLEKLVRHVNDRVRRAAEEEPLQVIAIVAGSAFVAGAILRVWRSHAYK
ncbi:MAG TPA: hypothetical protein VFA74_13085 [Terriglobales bacterium]|nr:hypothetical protein [Terriglobales bacterium]